jgi:hypothetical protein
VSVTQHYKISYQTMRAATFALSVRCVQCKQVIEADACQGKNDYWRTELAIAENALAELEAL